MELFACVINRSSIKFVECVVVKAKITQVRLAPFCRIGCDKLLKRCLIDAGLFCGICILCKLFQFYREIFSVKVVAVPESLRHQDRACLCLPGGSLVLDVMDGEPSCRNYECQHPAEKHYKKDDRISMWSAHFCQFVAAFKPAVFFKKHLDPSN